jgi:putative transposase
LSVVNDIPQIKRVIQDAITPLFIAIDGRGIPSPPKVLSDKLEGQLANP